MRKQYHFRQVGEDTYIWDVHHLVELSQDFPIDEVLLSNIQELNEAYWFPDTHPTTQQMIEHFQLIQQADLSYPIILSADGKVMDGMHRVAKAKLLNHLTIKAIRFEITPPANFINIDEDNLDYDDGAGLVNDLNNQITLHTHYTISTGKHYCFRNSSHRVEQGTIENDGADMRVEIEGLQQGAIEVELQLLPRVGEVLKVMYGADAEVKGEVTAVEHYINQHANEHKVILTIRPLFGYTSSKMIESGVGCCVI